jgi:hypothetical protein
MQHFQLQSKNAIKVLKNMDKFLFFYFRTTEDITSNFIYRKLFFGADPNYPAVYIDKVKILHGEVDDEM